VPRLRWAAALCGAAIMAVGGAASAAAAPAGHGSFVAAQVDGQTYVLLGPSVFGVTVQQDPLAYHAIKLADGTVRGRWRYDYWQAGQETTFSGPVTCMSVSDNGAGRHPVIPDRTTFVGIGTMSQTIAYCNDEPAPHFIFDVQLGGLSVKDLSSTR